MWKVLVHDIIVTQLQRHCNATDCSFVLNPSQSKRKREFFFISHIVFIFLNSIYRFKFFITFLERNFSYFYSNVKLLRNASEFNSCLVHNIQQLTSVVRGIRNYCVVFLFSFYFNNQSSEQKHNKINLLIFFQRTVLFKQFLCIKFSSAMILINLVYIYAFTSKFDITS